MPPQSSALLTQIGMGHQPLAAGVDHSRRMPTEGLPFMNGGFGAMAGMAATPAMYRAFGQVGMTPMGVGHDQNTYDRLMNQQFTAMQMQAMQQAAQSDRASYMKTFRGLAAVTGTPFGAEQRRAAQALSNAATTAAPVFAEMMPEFLDQMGGSRGSATVLARRMIDAGRYRVDPTTGRMGMTAESVGAASSRLYGDLYSDANLPHMRGVTAGQAGSMFQELQSRGMVGGAAASAGYGGYRGDDPRSGTFRAIEELRRTAPNVIQKSAAAAGVDLGKPVTAGDLDKLQLDPAVADKLRSFDTDRIKKSIKSYVGVVSAMKEIFGDMGRPNAPMAELVRSIEAMTNGSLSQMDPGRAAGMVRQTYNLAKQTGVSMDGAMMIQQHASQRAAAMGVEPVFGVQAAQGALGFGGAYRAQGHAAHTSWGAMNADQVQQLDANLRVQASASNAANRMSAAARLSEMSGGFDKDTDAGRFAEAVRGGMNQFRGADGQLRSTVVSDRDFAKLMTGATVGGKAAGISEGDVQSVLSQKEANREYGERYNVGNAVRRAQGRDELRPFVGSHMTSSLAARFKQRLVEGGMSDADAAARSRELAGKVGAGVTEGMFAMSTEEFSDTASRNAGIGGLIEKGLSAAGGDDVLGGLDAAGRKRFFSQSADRAVGSANWAIAGSQYRAFGNVQNVHRLNNDTTLDEADRQQMQARFTGQMQEAMSPLGKGSVLSRAVDALQNVRPGDKTPMASVISQALGGVKTEDINRAILPQIQKLSERRQALEKLQNDVMQERDPQKKAALVQQLAVVERELKGQATGLAKVGEQFGLFSADSLTGEDLGRGLDSGSNLVAAQNDLAGLRGGFGLEVSDAQIARVKGKPIADETEQAAVLLGRRQKDLDDIEHHLADPKHALSADQQKTLTEWMGKARSFPDTAGMNDGQARVQAAAMMRANLRNMDPAELAKIGREGAKDDNDARALIRTKRRLTPYRTDKAGVDEVMKEYPGMTEREAYDQGNARLRAVRLGVDKEDVAEFRAKNKGFEGAQGETDAIAELFKQKADKMFEVTDADRAAMKADPRYVDPSAEDVEKFSKVNDVTGLSPDQIKERMTNARIMGARQGAHDARFNQMWRSNEGAAFREAADNAGQDVETVSQKLVQSPQMVQRLGTRAVEMSDTLRGGQQRLREMANAYAGGDVGRLMAGHYTIDWRKDGAKDTISRVRRQVTAISAEQRSIMAELHEQEGQPGRRWQLGDEGEARNRVLDEEVAGGRLTKEKADQMRSTNLSPLMRERVLDARRQLGGDGAARDFLGIARGATNLSELQHAKIAAARYGAGAGEEAAGVLGRDKFDALDAKGQEAAVAQMRKGFGGSAAEAQKYLGLSDKDMESDEAKWRVRAVADGLSSDAHVRQLSGLSDAQLATKDPKEQKENAKTLEAMKLGLSSEQYARNRLGLAPEKMDGDLLRRAQVYRERAGNEAEARRLMGIKPGQQLGVVQKAMLGQMAYDVGTARRLSPDQPIDAKSIPELAKALGVDPKDLEGVARVGKLQLSAQQKAAAASNANPVDLGRDILKEYGFSVGDEATKAQKEFGALLEGTAGRGFGERALATTKTLKSLAGGGLDKVDAMAEDYYKAVSGGKDRDAKMKEFRKQHGMLETDEFGQVTGKSNEAFRSFEDAVQFQQQSGLLSFGRGRARRGDRVGEDQLTRLTEQYMKGGEQARPQGGGGGEAGPQRIELSGKVKLDSDGYLDVAGVTAGGRGHVPAQP